MENLENRDVVLEALRKPLVSPGCLVQAIICSGIVLLMMALVFPAVRRAGPPAMQAQCKNNLRQIGLAIQNYHDNYGSFPPAYTIDSKGRRLHSWRTLLLPYLDHSKLYESIDLNKPWDDPDNQRMSGLATPYVFQCSSAGLPDGTTAYLAVVAADGCFSGAIPRSRSEITDGPSITLSVIEATTDQAVPWMSPVDVDQAWLMRVSPRTKSTHPHILQAVFADGLVHPLQLTLTTKERRALISIAGGD